MMGKRKYPKQFLHTTRLLDYGIKWHSSGVALLVSVSYCVSPSSAKDGECSYLWPLAFYVEQEKRL